MDRNEIVECVGPNGHRIYMRRHAAKAFGLRITGNPKTTDGHGHPLRPKPKVKLPTTTEIKLSKEN